jgi:thioredoxin 1
MVENLNVTRFDELMKEDVVLVDFYAVWCGPCRMMAPVVEEIAEENPSVRVGKVDVDEVGELAQRFGIVSIPTLLVFKNGQLVNKFVGVQDKQTILNALR